MIIDASGILKGFFDLDLLPCRSVNCVLFCYNELTGYKLPEISVVQTIYQDRDNALQSRILLFAA